MLEENTLSMLKVLDPTCPRVVAVLIGMLIGLSIVVISAVVMPIVFGGQATIWNSYGVLTVCTAILTVHIIRRRRLSGSRTWFQSSLIVACVLCLVVWTMATAIILGLPPVKG